MVAGKYQNAGDQREGQKCCGVLPGTHPPLRSILEVYTISRLKILAFDFAGANGFEQIAAVKDQKFSICSAGGVLGRAPAKTQAKASARVARATLYCAGAAGFAAGSAFCGFFGFSGLSTTDVVLAGGADLCSAAFPSGAFSSAALSSGFAAAVFAPAFFL